MNYFDCITANPETLAKELFKNGGSEYYPYCELCRGCIDGEMAETHEDRCRRCLIDWLNQPVEEKGR